MRKLNNFNGVTEIIAGLQAVSIHRLKKTWAALPESSYELFKELASLVDQNYSYKNLRTSMIKATPPCIPPMAVYLKDLTFIEDGNPDMIRGNLINFYKRRQLSKVIIKMKEYQQVSDFLFGGH